MRIIVLRGHHKFGDEDDVLQESLLPLDYMFLFTMDLICLVVLFGYELTNWSL